MRTARQLRWWVAVLAAICWGHAGAQDLFRQAGPWQDDTGATFQLESLYGTPTVVTMAYGACRRVCSTSLRMMEQLQALADARQVTLNFVVIGLDPQADRPADWAAYRTEHRLQRPNWHFLSGSEAATRQFARRLGVRYWRYGEHTLHDLRIVLLSGTAQPLRSVVAFDDRVESLLP